MTRNIKKEFILWGIIMSSFMVAAPIIGYFTINGTFHTSSDRYTEEQIFNKYPTPKSLDDALRNNQINYNDLPARIQELMDLYHSEGKK